MNDLWHFSRDGYAYTVEVLQRLPDMRLEVRDVNGKEHQIFIVEPEELSKIRAVTRRAFVWRYGMKKFVQPKKSLADDDTPKETEC